MRVFLPSISKTKSKESMSHMDVLYSNATPEVVSGSFIDSTKLSIMMPLDKVSLPHVANNAGMRYNVRAHPPVRQDDSRLANVVILTSRYKNDFASIVKAISEVKQLKRVGWSSPDLTLSDIIIFGSGGAPDISCTFQQNALSVTKNTIHTSMPTAQNPYNPTNKVLQEICCRSGVVAVFVKGNEFRLPNDNEDDGYFLGYFEITEVSLKKETMEDIILSLEGEDNENQRRLSRFREQPHYACRLCPLFTPV
jgi:hypothetical protein